MHEKLTVGINESLECMSKQSLECMSTAKHARHSTMHVDAHIHCPTSYALSVCGKKELCNSQKSLKRSFCEKEKDVRSSQNSNLGLLNSSQMLLPTEPLELWYWSRGYKNVDGIYP